MKPKPVEGRCNAQLHVGDDYGDGHSTMMCVLEPMHDGDHQESWVSSGSGRVTVTWEWEDPQIAMDALQREIESGVKAMYPDVIFDIDLIDDQLVYKVEVGTRTAFFRLESLSDIWISSDLGEPGEVVSRNAAVTRLVDVLR